jgi:hypothetical protein
MMNAVNDPQLERITGLLADRATQGLSAEESAELVALLAGHPEVDKDAFDRAAAALDLALLVGEYEPLPDDVRSRADRRALRWMAQRKRMRLTGAPEAIVEMKKPRAFRSWAPWLLAAACLLVALTAWWPATRTASPAAQRTALLARAATTTTAWAANDLGVSGDVVWNGRQQAGFLRFRGLSINDPDDIQYQLWIFDETRRAYSDDVAVDGGVFDIDRDSGEVIVPIRAALRVGKPFLFAVTTEPPGGVVKHNPDRDPDRYRIILTASL